MDMEDFKTITAVNEQKRLELYDKLNEFDLAEKQRLREAVGEWVEANASSETVLTRRFWKDLKALVSIHTTFPELSERAYTDNLDAKATVQEAELEAAQKVSADAYLVPYLFRTRNMVVPFLNTPEMKDYLLKVLESRDYVEVRFELGLCVYKSDGKYGTVTPARIRSPRDLMDPSRFDEIWNSLVRNAAILKSHSERFSHV